MSSQIAIQFIPLENVCSVSNSVKSSVEETVNLKEQKFNQRPHSYIKIPPTLKKTGRYCKAQDDCNHCKYLSLALSI